ncbi:MAG: hypothetical protein GY913_20570 [Proteobacteria bacterium]|nr:hypothetical protein [Pseudomonadota bacterium]MCP4919303.1 hypothetical protein [Pseudomonadota bacterium]
MLTWTDAGAVERPTRVQIRVQRAYPGRVRAGAPVPTRSMSTAEIEENLVFFTAGMSGPRSTPCTHLVLSGVGVAGRDDTPEILTRARELGFTQTVLHAGGEDLDHFDAKRVAGLADVVVVPVQPGPGGAVNLGTRAIATCRAEGIDVVANTVLSEAAIRSLRPAARAMARALPTAATFTYPFPIGGNRTSEVPRPAAVVAALGPAIGELERAGVRVAVRGLPACYLGRLAHLAGRSANRWYVDADHQRGEAILFFPAVARFHKGDACRFCTLDGDCDGFFATYLRRSGFPPLEPIGQ